MPSTCSSAWMRRLLQRLSRENLSENVKLQNNKDWHKRQRDRDKMRFAEHNSNNSNNPNPSNNNSSKDNPNSNNTNLNNSNVNNFKDSLNFNNNLNNPNNPNPNNSARYLLLTRDTLPKLRLRLPRQ